MDPRRICRDNTKELKGMLAIYSLVVGIVLIIIGGVEMASPLKSFAIWRAWASSRAFFLHGIILMAVGLPLTVYRGPASLPAFIVGLVASLTGPFILLFPGKVKKIFDEITAELNEMDLQKMMRFEASLRLMAGAACVIGFLVG